MRFGCEAIWRKLLADLNCASKKLLRGYLLWHVSGFDLRFQLQNILHSATLIWGIQVFWLTLEMAEMATHCFIQVSGKGNVSLTNFLLKIETRYTKNKQNKQNSDIVVSMLYLTSSVSKVWDAFFIYSAIAKDFILVLYKYYICLEKCINSLSKQASINDKILMKRSSLIHFSCSFVFSLQSFEYWILRLKVPIFSNDLKIISSTFLNELRKGQPLRP